jgi:hypothetical protein
MQQRVTVQPGPGMKGWIVAYEDDPTPISSHETEQEAEIAAREHVREFGGGAEVIVYHRNGDRTYQQFDPEHWDTPTVRDVKAGESLA